MSADIDTDALPPTQYLILEVLAARWRLGEPFWTFPDRLKPAARALQQAGLVWTNSSPTPRCFQVSFTDAGRNAAMSDSYSPPVHRCDPPDVPASPCREEWASEHDFPDGATRFEAGTDRRLAEIRVARWTERGVPSRLMRREATVRRTLWISVPWSPETSEGAR